MSSLQTERFDRAVLSTPGISIPCSSSDWILSASSTLLCPERIHLLELGGGWVAFGESEFREGGRWFHPLEFSWGFSCPVIGSTLEGQAAALTEFAASVPARSLFCVAGFSTSSFLYQLLEDWPYELINFDPVAATVLRARLDDGADEYFKRRSRKFQKNLDVSERKATNSGIEFSLARTDSSANSLMDRILAVEKQSWKYAAEESIFQADGYEPFYRAVLSRTFAGGKLRAMFATLDGEDIAYNFGAVFGDCFRGFQMGFDDRHRAVGLGNLLQTRMMRQVAEEGVRIYDLGMSTKYKENWADEALVLGSVAFFT